jgi:hypothetical protein
MMKAASRQNVNLRPILRVPVLFVSMMVQPEIATL